MTALDPALQALTVEELQSYAACAKRNGWAEILYDVREEQQRRMARDGPSDTIAGP